jgi:hypothetical protein
VLQRTARQALKTAAWCEMGIARSTLHYKMKMLGVQ